MPCALNERALTHTQECIMRWTIALFPLLTACSASFSASRSGITSDPAVLVGSRIEKVRGSETALEFIRRTNPLYLNTRAVRMPGSPFSRDDLVAVYVNGTYSGELDALEMIPAREIVSVRRVSASEGANVFGRTHRNGALIVRMRR
jgi:hypothetical protein